MSLPSIKTIQEELEITDLSKISKEKQEEILVEAMKRDLGPALAFLHNHLHEKGSVMWQENPGSTLGKMLIRIHAGDVLRQMAEKHFCHGRKLVFFNCCSGFIGENPKDQLLTQLQMQNGDLAKADC